MDFAVYQYIVVGVILVAASVLQCTIGFASGIFSIPVMLMIGLKLPQAVMVAVLAATLQNLTGYVTLRHEINYRVAIRPIAIRLIALPAGAFMLLHCEHRVEPSTVKQIVGGIVLSVLFLQWAFRVQPREKLHTGWEFLAFGSSGVLLGFCGMGGPPMVLWVHAHLWSAVKSRAFLFLVFMACMLPQAGLLLFLFPAQEVVPALVLGLLMTPLVLLGTMIGLHIGEHLSKTLLRRASYVVIGIIGVTSIVSPIVMPMLHTAARAAH